MKRAAGLVAVAVAVAVGTGGAVAEPLNVGILKMAALTNAWIAKKEKIFEKYGLDVNLIEFRAGAEAAAGLQGGSADIVLMIPGTAMTASERGFDLVAVFQNEIGKSKGPDSGSVQVLVDSPIRTLKDLAGKKVAVSQLHGQNTVGAQMLIKDAGVDLTKVQFLELPFSTHYDALKNKQVDAVVSVDPYTTQLQSSGVGRVISWNYVESIPEQPVGAWWVKRAFLARNGDVIDRFNKAIKESIDYMNADHDRARAQVVAYTGLKPELVKEMPLITWDYQVKPQRWQQVIELMTRSGGLRKPHKADEFFAEQLKPYVAAASQ